MVTVELADRKDDCGEVELKPVNCFDILAGVVVVAVGCDCAGVDCLGGGVDSEEGMDIQVFGSDCPVLVLVSVEFELLELDACSAVVGDDNEDVEGAEYARCVRCGGQAEQLERPTSLPWLSASGKVPPDKYTGTELQSGLSTLGQDGLLKRMPMGWTSGKWRRGRCLGHFES